MNHKRSNLILPAFLLLLAFAGNSHAERADRDKPIKMEADHVTVDDPNQTSIFEGNVRMQQGTLLIEASKILIKQDKNGYNQITATGNLCHFKQKQDNSNDYAEGFGERIEYDSFAETANIFGQARVKREGDDVQGEHIIYSTKTGVFQVFGSGPQMTEKPGQGRVTIVIQPKSRQNDPNLPASPKPASAPRAQ
jgi:lipopolysaccharide export system protein LptA